MKKTRPIAKVILLSLFLTVFALNASAQKVTLSFQNETFEKVLNSIKLQTSLSLVFSEQLVDLNRKVSINAISIPVEDALKQLLNGTNLSFEIKNSKLYLVEKKSAESKSEPKQSKKITGLVTDEKGDPIIGASILVKGISKGTITDVQGKFYLETSINAVLRVSYIGYVTKDVVVGNVSQLTISLAEDTKKLDEVVVVGYGTQKKETITGSISNVKGDVIALVPVASTANTLAGRLPGLVSLQSSGQPGFDAASLSIRGFGDALVIVDGVESSFNNIDANQIESVSILKDGAASIYGSRAGNGVILITTKRGGMSKPIITLNSSYTLQGITSMLKPVNAGQYAQMLSETWLQAGKNPNLVPFTQSQIQSYYDGTDPQYPNTNWYNVLVRDWAPQQQHNLSVRGGSDKIKYFGFFGYLNQETMWKTSGGNYDRFNLQSNIDAKISDNLSLQFDLAAIHEDRQFPWRNEGAGLNSVWQDFWNTLPIYPSVLPDPTKISFADGGGIGGAHVSTNTKISGYNNNTSKNYRGTISLNYTFKQIQGLSVKAFVNYIENGSYTKYFRKPVDFYTYDTNSDFYTLAGSLGTKAELNETFSQDRSITGQMSVAYDRIFAKDHHISALAIYEAIDYNSNWFSAGRINYLTTAIDQLFAGSTVGMTNNGAAYEMGRVSYICRLNYSYKDRYLLESSIRRDGSAKFAPDKRWGNFPSISLGWRISEEPFMQSFKNLDNLKLRASYGVSGLDNVANFAFLSGYNYGGTYLFGSTAQQGISASGMANPNLTWENIAISNIGLDFSFWNRKLYGEVDAFYRTLDGIPATRMGTLPSTFGATLPVENINSINDRGFELKLGTAGKYNNFSWDVSGNISWSRSKWNYFEEPVYTDPDQARIYTHTGRWTDNAYGYLSDGLFTSQEQINNLLFNQDGQGNISLRPGDIRYKDTNSDGILDWKDQAIIGKGGMPHWMLGFNTSFKFQNISLDALFQGAFDYYTDINLQQGRVPPVQMFDLRWTEANNNPNALVPRLGGSSTNLYFSDYRYMSAGYIRLKSLSIGYDLPKQLIQAVKLNQVKLYFAGTNLFTFDKLSKYGLDPEAPSGQAGFYYPQQRTLTFGANINF